MSKQRRTSSEIPRLASEDKALREKEAKQKGKSAIPAKRFEMEEHRMTHDELAKFHGTHLTKGLSEAEAARRLRENGRNELTPPPSEPEWKKFLAQMTGFFSLLLWAGGVLCFTMYGLKPEDKENMYLGVVLVAVVFLTGVFSYYQDSKSAAIMEGFKNFLPQQVSVTRDGKKFDSPATELVLGDLVHVSKGDKIPADIVAVECDNAKVDNSSLTGESDQLARVPKNTHESFLETKNVCFFGTSITEGFLTGVIVRTGDHTYIGSIANEAASAENPETPIKLEIDHFVKIVSVVAIALGLLFCIISIAMSHNWVSTLVFTIGIIVANVPEGLLATLTVSLTLTAKRMATKMVLVKNLEAVETLGSTTTICSDKTGTLTQNLMTVSHLWYNGKVQNAKTSTQEATFDRKDPQFQDLQRVATLCNRATFKDDAENMAKELSKRGTIGDASESALLKFVQPLRDAVEYRTANRKLAEIPFSSAYKFQVSIHKLEDKKDDRKLLVMKGAPERVLERCGFYQKDGKEHKIDNKFKADFEKSYLSLGGLGERVLGFAHLYIDGKKYHDNYEFETDASNPNFPLSDLVFVGFMSLIDPPRPAVPGAVAKCKNAGIKVIMVTGDHPITAEAIGKQVGILTSETANDVSKKLKIPAEKVDTRGLNAIVIHGEKLYDLTDRQWDEILAKPQIVFARTTPSQKLEIVSRNQEKGCVVAVTGDGVNDSPALKKADIGVAMGIAGSDVSKDAADMILLDDNFASIVNGIEEGRIIFDNLKKSIAYTLSSNIPEISPFLVFIVVQVPLPLTTVLILCIDLGTDMIPAISLAYETAESDIMNRAPRRSGIDRLVSFKLVCFSYLQIGVIQALAGFYCYFVVMNDGFKGTPGLPPHVLPFLTEYGDDDMHLYCMTDDEGNLSFCDTFTFSLQQTFDDISNKPFGISDAPCYAINDSFDGWDKAAGFANQDNCWQHWSPDEKKDILAAAQTSYWCSIVVVQWADILICKTRKLSMFQQGMHNNMLNFGLLSETFLSVFFCYIPGMDTVFGTRPINFTHWLPGLPFFIYIIAYDELRKLKIRYDRRKLGRAGWTEINTYW